MNIYSIFRCLCNDDRWNRDQVLLFSGVHISIHVNLLECVTCALFEVDLSQGIGIFFNAYWVYLIPATASLLDRNGELIKKLSMSFPCCSKFPLRYDIDKGFFKQGCGDMWRLDTWTIDPATCILNMFWQDFRPLRIVKVGLASWCMQLSPQPLRFKLLASE